MNAFSSIHNGINSKKNTIKSYTVTGSPTYTETTLNNYKIISITAATSATITFNGISNVDILVVGGGGAGGQDNGGGGGGGGVIYLSNISVTSGFPYTITVGNGGATTGNYGSNGGDSVFGTYTAIGGGGGADDGRNLSTPTGGCGGGGSVRTPNINGGLATQPTSTSRGFGNNGGRGISGGGVKAGGGGGGAGGPGSNAKASATPYGGTGGIGYLSDITGTATYYAGGGGGGSNIQTSDTNRRDGGLGGGGAGAVYNLSAVAGTTNTGGGGGGGGTEFVGLPGAGGSGIIIIRYLL